MTGKDLGAVAIRVWGVFLLLGALVAMPSLVLVARASVAPGEPAELMRAAQSASMLNVGLQATVGLFLILCGGWVARSVIPDTPVLQIGGDGLQLHALGFALVGAIVLIAGLQEGAVAAYALLTKPSWAETGRMEYALARHPEAMVRAVVQVIAGLFLLLGKEGFARGWAGLRASSK